MKKKSSSVADTTVKIYLSLTSAPHSLGPETISEFSACEPDHITSSLKPFRGPVPSLKPCPLFCSSGSEWEVLWLPVSYWGHPQPFPFLFSLPGTLPKTQFRSPLFRSRFFFSDPTLYKDPRPPPSSQSPQTPAYPDSMTLLSPATGQDGPSPGHCGKAGSGPDPMRKSLGAGESFL